MAEEYGLCVECLESKHNFCLSAHGEVCTCDYIRPDGTVCSIWEPYSEIKEDEPPVDYLEGMEGLIEFKPRKEEPNPREKEFEPLKMDDFITSNDYPRSSGSYSRGYAYSSDKYNSADDTLKTTYSNWKPSPPKRKASKKVLDEILDRNLLNNSHTKVYTTLFDIGPATAGELTRAIQLDQGGGGYHKRLPELDRMSLVTKVGKRACKVTGKTCDLWDVTDSLPIAKFIYKRVEKPLACAVSVTAAIEIFTAPFGWKVVNATQAIEEGCDWAMEVEVEGGDKFIASGFKVLGGVVLTSWK